MLDSALALILQLLDLHTGWVSLLDEQGQFTLAAAHGLPPALEANGRAAMRWIPAGVSGCSLRGTWTLLPTSWTASGCSASTRNLPGPTPRR
jgi:hypothetical protein